MHIAKLLSKTIILIYNPTNKKGHVHLTDSYALLTISNLIGKKKNCFLNTYITVWGQLSSWPGFYIVNLFRITTLMASQYYCVYVCWCIHICRSKKFTPQSITVIFFSSFHNLISLVSYSGLYHGKNGQCTSNFYVMTDFMWKMVSRFNLEVLGGLLILK